MGSRSSGALKIGIGDEVYELIDHDRAVTLRSGSVYERFLSDAPATVVLRLIAEDVASAPVGPLLFDSKGVWALHKGEQGPTLVFRAAKEDGQVSPYCVLRMDGDLLEGTLHVQGDKASIDLDRAFGYPMSEILAMGLLARGRGVVLHAAGLALDGQGELFCGVSGAGKSTIARLWCADPRAEILSDDRVIVREKGGQLWIYGTPWHGEAGFASPASAPLRRVFLLKQGDANKVRALSTAEAMRRLVLVAFLPFWNHGGMRFSLDFVEQMIRDLTCFELTFVNDHRIVDFVRQL